MNWNTLQLIQIFETVLICLYHRYFFVLNFDRKNQGNPFARIQSDDFLFRYIFFRPRTAKIAKQIQVGMF